MTLEQAKCIAMKYLTSKIETKKKFYQKYHLKQNDITNLNKLLQKYDSDLYNLYKKGKKILTEEEKIKQEEELQQIIHGIMYGINGREFDLLDYYTITKRDFSSLMTICCEGNHHPMEKKCLTDFFRKNGDYNLDRYNKYDLHPQMINEKIELESNLIIGGYPVTKEDKMEAIRFLEENQIPKYRILYRLKLKRIIHEKQKNSSVQYCKSKKSSL